MIGKCKRCGLLTVGDLCRLCRKLPRPAEGFEPLVGGAYCQRCERPSVVVTDTVLGGQFYQVLACQDGNCGEQITRELSELERGAL